jgi:hypothetical protein
MRTARASEACHSRCFFLSGTHRGPLLYFLLRNVHWLSSSCERANFISNKRRKQDSYQQQKTDSHAPSGNIKATIWHNVGEKGPFFATTFSRPFKDQTGAWRNGTSFGLHDLKALTNVALEAKEWIAAHGVKR